MAMLRLYRCVVGGYVMAMLQLYHGCVVGGYVMAMLHFTVVVLWEVMS